MNDLTFKCYNDDTETCVKCNTPVEIRKSFKGNVFLVNKGTNTPHIMYVKGKVSCVIEVKKEKEIQEVQATIPDNQFDNQFVIEEES